MSEFGKLISDRFAQPLNAHERIVCSDSGRSMDDMDDMDEHP